MMVPDALKAKPSVEKDNQPKNNSKLLPEDAQPEPLIFAEVQEDALRVPETRSKNTVASTMKP